MPCRCSTIPYVYNSYYCVCEAWVGFLIAVVSERCQTTGGERGNKAGQDTNPAIHPGGDIRRGR